MRVFKNKWFTRWADGESIPDSVLWVAASDVVAGRVDADLGGRLFKKRLARAGQGKSGGYRTIIGYRKANSDRVVFLYAFAKNAKGNISDKEEAALSLAAESFVNTTDSQISQMLLEGLIREVISHE